MSVGYLAGYIGEGEIGYAGTNAIARARLAGEIVRERLAGRFAELRVELDRKHVAARPRARYRTSVRTKCGCASPAARRSREEAAIVGDEVEALYTNGPAGGGGARKYVNEQIGIVSTLIDRARVQAAVTVREWNAHAEAV